MERELLRTDVLIIGAGPAGLAVGACLRRADVSLEIVDQADEIGASWKRHYDRLCLHTHKGHSGLPHRPMPRTYPKYPSRDQVVEYLEAYAEYFGLRPRLGEQALRIGPEDTGWSTTTSKAEYRSRFVVLATGLASVPHLPTWPGQSTFSSRILHSSWYRHGGEFTGQRVLVVGFGNSAGEIALDLAENGAEASMSVRHPVNVIPREVAGISFLSLAKASAGLPAPLADALSAPVRRFLYRGLGRFGLRMQRYGPLTQVLRDRRVPLIDVGTMSLIRKGRIRVFPGIRSFVEGAVGFDDGRTESFDAIVLATGYRPWLRGVLEGTNGALDDEGVPVRSGAPIAPGLFACGFHVSPVGMLNEIGNEARKIARLIAAER